jgi:plasmid maintenance system antidote protein VapI
MQRDCTPTEFLRAAIRVDGRPVHRIAREAGVSQAVVSRFMAGKRGITLSTADRLCGVMNIGLQPLRRSA